VYLKLIKVKSKTNVSAIIQYRRLPVLSAFNILFQHSAVYTYGSTFNLGLMLPFMKNV